MADKNKLSKALEEQVQSLAGDIYIQIEDKITSLISSMASEVEISDSDVEQHESFKKLQAAQQAAELASQAELNTLSNESFTKVKQLQDEIAKLSEQASKSDAELKNHGQLNSAKLTDTEVVLKEKLSEISILTENLATAEIITKQTNENLFAAEEQLKVLSDSLKDHKNTEINFSKSDKAKSATIEVQNQQISDLQLKFDHVSSELEVAQTKKSQVSDKTAEELVFEKQKVIELNKQVASLTSEFDKTTAALTASQEHHKSLFADNANELATEKHQVSELTQQVSTLTAQLHQLQLLQQQSSDVDDNYKATIQTLTSEQSALNSKVTEFQQAQVIAENTMQQLSSDVAKYKQLTESQEKELVDSQHQLNKNSEQINTLSENNNSQEKNQKSQSDKISQLELVNKGLTEQQEQIQKQNSEKLQIVAKDYQTQIIELNDKIAKFESKKVNEQAEINIAKEQLNSENTLLTNQMKDLQQKFETLTVNFDAKIADVELFEQHVASLKEQVRIAKEAENDVINRINTHREKSESDHNKARETIKYLRDENFELTTTHEQKVSELEDKLTESRLKFKYAQKQ
jgi:chromosome segregation ATPase